MVQSGTYGMGNQRISRPVCDLWQSLLFFEKNKNTLNAVVLRVKNLEHLSNKERRHQAYYDGVKSVYPGGTRGVRRRLGYCFVEMVRVFFSDEEYKGFRYSDYHTNEGM